ncbi:MAG: endonuclease/exonuclease/phosphatase family protein [Planctomycetota bacterium]|nr:endonuclease/exonuclease/phosphatase family protein [Planctomycetota bacterium]
MPEETPVLEKTLRVLSYNIKMLPGWIGDGAQDMSRANQIMNQVLSQSHPYDVVCLQEVFDEDVRELLEERLSQDNGAWFVQPKCDDGDFLHQDSGLFFASRYPWRGNQPKAFEEFEEATSWDRFSDKGIFRGRLNLDSIEDGLTLSVLQAHLQSDPDEVGEHSHVRRAQLLQIRSFLSRTLNKRSQTRSLAAVMMGDFNIAAAGASPEDNQDNSEVRLGEEYKDMIGLLAVVRDLYLEKEPESHGFTWDGTRNSIINQDDPSDKHRLRLDYIFAVDAIPSGQVRDPVRLRRLRCHSVRVVEFREDNEDLSDHYAVEAVIGF